MEPGIIGLADMKGGKEKEKGRERERESEREGTSLLRANKRNCTRICPHPPAYTLIVLPHLVSSRLALPRAITVTMI